MHPTAAYAVLNGLRVYRFSLGDAAWRLARELKPDAPGLFFYTYEQTPGIAWEAQRFASSIDQYREVNWSDVPDADWERLPIALIDQYLEGN